MDLNYYIDNYLKLTTINVDKPKKYTIDNYLSKEKKINGVIFKHLYVINVSNYQLVKDKRSYIICDFDFDKNVCDIIQHIRFEHPSYIKISLLVDKTDEIDENELFYKSFPMKYLHDSSFQLKIYIKTCLCYKDIKIIYDVISLNDCFSKVLITHLNRKHNDKLIEDNKQKCCNCNII